jgi:mannose-1-phosphate guanylyltransferase
MRGSPGIPAVRCVESCWREGKENGFALSSIFCGKISSPKQYVNFIGTRSMLEHTLHRAEKLIPRERVFTVINEAHLGFPEVKRQISQRRQRTVIVQPENKETAPGLLLPLMHVSKRYPNSTVVIFTSDHFVLEEENQKRASFVEATRKQVQPVSLHTR